jgi:predicted aspartyl protease
MAALWYDKSTNGTRNDTPDVSRCREELLTAMLDDATRLIYSASGATALPLLFQPQVLRCMAAGPGGHPLTVLLDTGTDPSAIDLGLARRLGLRLGEFAMGQSAASNAVPFTETILPWLRLGDFTFRDLFVLAVDLGGTPFPVDIVLGYNVLRQLVFRVDYVNNMLSLSHPDLGMPELSPQGALLPLTFFEHFPALQDVTLCDQVHLPLATIDTGSNGGLTLGPDLAARLGLQPNGSAVVSALGTGFGGGCEVLVGQADLVRVGPFALCGVDLDTPGNGTGDLRRNGRANIGNRLLARFASITLDYERRLCAIEPRQSADDGADV